MDNNLFCLVQTIWSAKGVEIAVLDMKKKGIKLEGDIFIEEHSITGRSVFDSVFTQLEGELNIVEIKKFDYDGELNHFTYIKKFWGTLKNRYSDSPIYIINPGFLNLRWPWYVKKKYGRDVCYIMTDDGFGTYWSRFYPTISEVLLPNNIIHNGMYKLLMKRKCMIDYSLVYKNSSGRLQVKKDIAELYSNYFSRKKVILDERVEEYLKGGILISTDALWAGEFIHSNIDIDLYELIKKAINQKTVVKLHPRETEKAIDRYKSTCFSDSVIIKTNEFSQEEILASLEEKPRCVISIFSSSTFYANIFWNIKAISLAKMFIKNNSISRETRKMANRYIKMFEGVIMFPQNEEELGNVLKNIMRDY